MTEKRDHLYTQKVYPSVNTNDLLEFRIPPNPNGQLDLSNVFLHFKTTLKTPNTNVEYIPQNFFGSKQFSSVEVRVNGEAVARRSCANEYFLSSYFQNMVNYGVDYQQSALEPIGIFDAYNMTTAGIASQTNGQKEEIKKSRGVKDGHHEMEIIMPIDSTIFYSNDLLPSNTPMALSFERLNANYSQLLFEDAVIDNVSLELSECYLSLPYKKDEEMFHLERNAIQRPLKVHFDEYSIKRFNVTPKGGTSVMMSDLISGSLPNKIFWSLQSINSYTGSAKYGSTRFNQNDLRKANLYINGKEATDFPVSMDEHNVVQPFTKFMENTNQMSNALCSRTMNMFEFKHHNFILSSTIAPGTTGSLSFEFDFASALTADLVLIVCCVYDKCMRIDHNRNFQIT